MKNGSITIIDAVHRPSSNAGLGLVLVAKYTDKLPFVDFVATTLRRKEFDA